MREERRGGREKRDDIWEKSRGEDKLDWLCSLIEEERVIRGKK